MTHPIYVASEIADWIRSDPIAAAQIRESIPETELAGLLKIPIGFDSIDVDEFMEEKRADVLKMLPGIFTATELRRAAALA